jgi:hypothetical protein
MALSRGLPLNVIEFSTKLMQSDLDLFDRIRVGLKYSGKCNSWNTANDLDVSLVCIGNNNPIVFWIRGDWSFHDTDPSVGKLFACLINFSINASALGRQAKIVLSDD